MFACTEAVSSATPAESKLVPLSHWLSGLYSYDRWMMLGYSSFGGDSGVPAVQICPRPEY